MGRDIAGGLELVRCAFLLIPIVFEVPLTLSAFAQPPHQKKKFCGAPTLKKILWGLVIVGCREIATSPGERWLLPPALKCQIHLQSVVLFHPGIPERTVPTQIFTAAGAPREPMERDARPGASLQR